MDDEYIVPLGCLECGSVLYEEIVGNQCIHCGSTNVHTMEEVLGIAMEHTRFMESMGLSVDEEEY